jgi:hypothetical protein
MFFCWKRVLISLGIVVVASVAYLWLFGAQTFFALEAQNTARKLPFVKRTPVPLPDLSVSEVSGATLSYFGYEFEVPWTDIDTEKTKIVVGNKAIIAFRSGNVLSVWSGQPHEFMNHLLEQGKIDKDTFRKIYGDGALQSDYNFKRLILETTPDKITFFTDRRTAVSQGVLLMVKAICVSGDPNSGIFQRISIRTSTESPKTIKRRTFSTGWSPGFDFCSKEGWTHGHFAG